MADVERTLLWKAINNGQVADVISRGIEIDHFVDEECQELYDFATHFMRTHGDPPSASVVKMEFPDFKAPLSKDPLSYHMERFILKVKERMAIDLVRDFHDSIEDPDEVAEIELHALDMARRLTELVPAPRAQRFSDVDKRIEEYKRRLKAGEVHGIFMGIPALDQETLGVQPHELVVIAAYLGMGKSTLMKYIAYSMYLQSKNTLYISLEEEGEAVLRKLDVMATNVKYISMKALEMEVGDLEQWKRIAEAAHRDRHERDIIVRDDIANCTVDTVMSEMMRYKPDAVFVDYLELMKGPRNTQSQHWEKISEIGVGLKQNARLMKIPIITAAQLNRDGGRGDVNLSNVSHQSVGKHADIILGLTRGKDEEEMEARKEMDVVALKIRDGKKTRCTMRWDLERMDLGEKGASDRFPTRKDKKRNTMIGHERRKRKRLEIAREVGTKENPFSGGIKTATKSKVKTRRRKRGDD